MVDTVHVPVEHVVQRIARAREHEDGDRSKGGRERESDDRVEAHGDDGADDDREGRHQSVEGPKYSQPAPHAPASAGRVKGFRAYVHGHAYIARKPMRSQSRIHPRIRGAGGQEAASAMAPGGPLPEECTMSLFRRGPERSEVEAQLENVRGVVSILGLSRANLSVPESLLREAEASLARNDTIRAMDVCGRAERIATSLEADYKAATETVATLKTQVERMKALGMSVEDTEEALQAIHARATSMREFDGSSVPDYAGARALAADATARADTRLALADRASTGIFAAEMAIEGAAETFGKGPVDALREPREL